MLNFVTLEELKAIVYSVNCVQRIALWLEKSAAASDRFARIVSVNKQKMFIRKHGAIKR